MRSVLVTRPQPAAAEMAEMLTREGLKVYISPLMEYAPIAASLDGLSDCQAIVFTSAQAVKIFTDMSPERSLMVFAVGEATAHAASRAGFDRVHTAAGDSGNLAGLIRARAGRMTLKKIFYPTGEDTAADLGKMLKGDGITVIRVPVYKAQFVQSLTHETTKALQNGEITTITLFSGRTAENFVQILKNAGLDNLCPQLEAVCLSAKIAKEVGQLKWRAVHVARNPDISSMLGILTSKQAAADTSAWLPAYPVIAVFGGIRPMARRLKLSASTIQEWQGTDSIPQKYNEMIIAAAEEDGISIDHLWRERKAQPAPPPGQPRPHFSRGPDRRQTPTVFDARGYVVSPNYVGPDRRSGLDRRDPDHAKLQQQRIRAEKWRFMNRTLLSGGIVTALILYAGLFILAPEFVETRNNAARLQEAEAQLAAANARLAEWQRAHGVQPQPQPAPPKTSLGGLINKSIEKIENTGALVSSGAATADSAATNVVESFDITEGVRELSGVLYKVREMNTTPEGRARLDQVIQRLEGVAAKSPAGRGQLAEAVHAEKARDAEMQALLGGVNKNNLGAAALLLVLNEMRGNMHDPKGFESDLAIMKKYFNDNPQLVQSIDALAPYAKNGVLSRSGLQKEFKGAAGDIVMAKLKGEDASFKERMLDRLSKYVKMRRVDDIEGNEVDAVVARAQILLEQNDVQGAMAELRTLEGAPAEAAAPWLQQAEGAAIADQVSTDMIQGILSQVSNPGQSVGDSLSSFFSEMMSSIGGGGGGNVIYLSPSMQPKGTGGVPDLSNLSDLIPLPN